MFLQQNPSYTTASTIRLSIGNSLSVKYLRNNLQNWTSIKIIVVQVEHARHKINSNLEMKIRLLSSTLSPIAVIINRLSIDRPAPARTYA